LAPYPLSLFNEEGMRKTKKSVFYDLFYPVVDVSFENAVYVIDGGFLLHRVVWQTREIFSSILNTVYVIDGGFLLHRVVWQTREIFSSILNKYVEYVKKYCNIGATVVFDGYPDDKTKSTKSVERYRREKKVWGCKCTF